MITPDTAFAACRFVHYLSLMVLWGVSAFLLFLTPAELGERVWQQFRAGPGVAVLASLVSAIAALPLQTAGIADDWSAAIDPQMLRDVIFSTTIGQAWLAQMAAALFLCIAIMRPGAWRRTAVALGAGLGLVALVLSGHAAMAEDWREAMQRANDAAHLLAAGGWLGGLVGLVAVLRLLEQPQWQAPAQVALRRFSTVGHWAVAITVLSGAANTALVVGGVPSDWSFPYQALLSAKIGLVGCMIALALFNRYVLVPRMAVNRSASLLALRKSSLTEIALGIAVIALVAVFGMMEPV